MEETPEQFAQDFADFTMGQGHLPAMMAGMMFAIIALAIWSLVWKGWALWRSARLNEKGWFIALLVLNTAGILEILYIFLISKGKKDGPTNKTL
jgi:hypothetical protein